MNVLETRIVSGIQNTGSYQLPHRLIDARNITYASAGIIRVQECNAQQQNRYNYMVTFIMVDSTTNISSFLFL